MYHLSLYVISEFLALHCKKLDYGGTRGFELGTMNLRYEECPLGGLENSF